MRPFLIDTDTASDDAVALILALRDPGARVEAITVVAGNVPLDLGVQNALYTVELCQSSVPVHAGCATPRSRPLDTAQFVHGDDGMGDLGLPLRGRTPASHDAVSAILEASRRHPGALTLVTLGPLTNVAAALDADPRLAQRVGRCVVMGGTSDSVGNVTPVSEYNVWVDPEAARVVFESGLPITMVGWDISRKYALIDPSEAQAFRALGTDRARFAMDIQVGVARFVRERMGIDAFDLPDPIAMAVALDPSIATSCRRLRVEIACGSDLTRGQTIIDNFGALGRPANAEIVLEASRPKFLAMLKAALQ